MASKQYQTPDVYVEEIATFPPSVAEVGTAIPAFVGYTATPTDGADRLRLRPTRITSFTEYEALFGGPKVDDIKIDLVTPDAARPAELAVKPAVNTQVTSSFLLYWAVKMFYDNGGGACYIVSVGSYGDTIEAGDATKGLVAGLEKLRLEDEPTLLVVPEATKLDYAGYKSVIEAMLKQCGELMDRFAILDTWNGDKAIGAEVPQTAPGAPAPPAGGGGAGGAAQAIKLVDGNRAAWGTSLKYGAAYYPFVQTTFNPPVAADQTNVKITGAGNAATLGAMTNTKAANAVKTALRDYFLVMPPSGAIAGVYAAVDSSRGVWKAPANVALNDVLGPMVKISSADQEGLNVDATTGKSINALRAFAGKGTLVWGARTLAGNDNEWRYISVRRFFNMVEESVKKSTAWAVFESNDANLWVKVRGMIENYLIDKWRDGALAGATPKDAFFVRCGLGTTMTAQDILQGRLNVEIGMAVVRPAEFIILKFSHKLQTS